MPKASTAKIDKIRSFNRVYTRKLGVLSEGFLDTRFSLTEARVLHELSEGEKTASEIGGALGLDAGYLSRILDRFAKARLISRNNSGEDRRSVLISLTRLGYTAYAPLEKRSRESVNAMVAALPSSGQEQFIDAMNLMAVLMNTNANSPKVSLRLHRAGDMGWITMRHGVLYAAEYGLRSAIRSVGRGYLRAVSEELSAEVGALLDRGIKRCGGGLLLSGSRGRENREAKIDVSGALGAGAGGRAKAS